MGRLMHIFRCITSSRCRMIRINHLLRQLYQEWEYDWKEVAKDYKKA